MQNFRYIFLIYVLSCASCASVFNFRYSKVDIHTSEPASLLMNGDTILPGNDKVIRIRLLNQKKVVDLQLESENGSKTVGLKPHNSTAFKLNFLLGYGVGYIIDAKQPKRYTYPGSIFIDMSGEEEVYVLYALPVRQDFYLKVSLPLVNSFLLQPPEIENRQSSYGYWGIGGELEYFYKKNKSFRFSVNYATNSTLFQNEPYDEFRFRKHMSTIYLHVSHQHQIHRFSVGYGISSVRNIYESEAEIDPLSSFYRTSVRNYNAIGLVFPSQVQLNEHLFLGLTYRPTFRQRYKDKAIWKFEHLLSVDIAWKFRLN